MQRPIDRRSLIGAGLGLSLASVAGAQEWGTPTPAEGEPDRPAWPPEHFKLWPGKAPGAPATLPTPRDTMNGPAGDRQLWLYGIPAPIVAVYRPPNPDEIGSAHVRTPVTNAQLVCRLLLEQKKNHTDTR